MRVCVRASMRACPCVSVCLSSTPVRQAPRENQEEQVGMDLGEAWLAFLTSLCKGHVYG